MIRNSIAVVAFLAIALRPRDSIFTEGSASPTWPACKDMGKDYNGFDYKKGLRFSSEDCAKWCAEVGGAPKCKKWVFKEVGTICHLKYTLGDVRDDASPLTPEDLKLFQPADGGSNATAAASNNSTAGNSTAGNSTSSAAPPDPARVKLELQRRLELNVTHSGAPDCQPVDKVYWPECTIVGEKIDAGSIIASSDPPFDCKSMEQCSLNCTLESTCTHWNFLADERVCSLHTDAATTTKVKTSVYGGKACLGMVTEPPTTGVPRIDGNWSPWSTLSTPCFKPKTGEIVDCGGGLQFRYRSCSNPTPRAGGKICHGKDYKSEACNTHACKLPKEFLWSEWGVPDKLCSVGTQKRTTMCGSLRRRLPNLEGRDSDDPAIYYPQCLGTKPNLAPEEVTDGAATLTDCFNNCVGEAQRPDLATPKCEHWMFNTTDNSCKFYAIVKYDKEASDSVVTGRKFCKGSTLYIPFCAEKNKNYTADVLGIESDVKSMEECSDACTKYVNDTCKNWFFQDNQDGSKICEMRGEKSGDATDVSLNTTTAWFGGKDCIKASEFGIPALPEEAQELSYKEICTENQLQVESRLNNTWNKEECPSPCLNNGDCPHSAKCIDESTDEAPVYKCVCQMGLEMVGGRCISPPPTTPTPRPIPSMDDTAKTVAASISKVASFVLIGFVSATLIIFAIFRIIDHGRFIHMNLEVALLAANICLLFEPDFGSASCRNISMCLHFFFTVVFAFLLLEGIFMYSLLSHVVTSNGMLSYVGNFLFGWGAGVCVLAFCISFEYDSYGGEYLCWLDMDTSLYLGEYVPIGIMFIVTVVLIEAAGSADETSMPKLPDQSEAQLISAKVMHRSLILRAGLALGSFVVGTMAVFQQQLELFFVYAIVNGTLGGLIFFFHCSSNEKIRELLGRCWSAVCPGKKKKTDLEPLNQDDADKKA